VLGELIAGSGQQAGAGLSAVPDHGESVVRYIAKPESCKPSS